MSQLTTLSLTLFLISNMIGSNIFIVPQQILKASNSYGISILTYLVCIFLVMCIGICYAELGSIYPTGAGDTTYISKGYSPFMGRLFSIISVVVIVPSMCSINLNLICSVMEYNSKISNVFIIAFLMILNVYSLSVSIKLQNALTVFRIFLMGVFIVLAMLVAMNVISSKKDQESLVPDFNWNEFLVSLLFIFGTFDGFNSGNFISERIRDPKKSLFIAIVTSVALVGLIYILICYSMFIVIPANVFFTSKNIMHDYFDYLQVESLRNYFPKFLVVLPCLGALNGSFILMKSIIKSHIRSYNVMLFLISLLVYVFSFFEMLSVLKRLGFFINSFYLLSILTLFKLKRKKQTILNIPYVIIGIGALLTMTLAIVSFYFGFFD